jgi:hypothetical protein
LMSAAAATEVPPNFITTMSCAAFIAATEDRDGRPTIRTVHTAA